MTRPWRQLFLALVLPLLALPGGLRVALCLCGSSIELAPACCASSDNGAGPSVVAGDDCCDDCGEFALPAQVSRLLERAEADVIAAFMAFAPEAFAVEEIQDPVRALAVHRESWRAPPWAAPSVPLRI